VEGIKAKGDRICNVDKKNKRKPERDHTFFGAKPYVNRIQRR
jgi:hypothetical protein